MSDFGIDFISDDEYEYLAIEISFKKQRLCKMFRRKDNVIEVEFIDDRLVLESRVVLKFPFSDFIDVMEKGRVDLMALDLSRVK